MTIIFCTYKSLAVGIDPVCQLFIEVVILERCVFVATFERYCVDKIKKGYMPVIDII